MKVNEPGIRRWMCAALSLLGGSVLGENVSLDALVRVNLADGSVRTERVALESISPSLVRFTYPKEKIDETVGTDPAKPL